MDTRHKVDLLRDACVSLRGPAYCDDKVAQGLAAVARHETGFGELKPFHRPAAGDAPAFESHNWGAQQCSTVAHGGVCPDGCFPATDTSPTSSGTSVAYLACFQVNASEEAGALSLARLLVVSRPKIAAALPSGDAQQIAQSMYDSRYFEGFGATPHERVRGYATALDRNARQTAHDLGGPSAITLPADQVPDLVIIGGLLAAAVAAVVKVALARVAQVDAIDALDDPAPDAGDPPPPEAP